MCHHSNCSCHGLDSEISRRGFLVAAAGTTMAGGFLLRAATAAEAAQTVQTEPQDEWPDVCVAYVRPKEKYWLGWPGTAWEVNRY